MWQARYQIEIQFPHLDAKRERIGDDIRLMLKLAECS